VRLHLGIRTEKSIELIATGGRVWCPQRGDLDVESCLTCSRLVGSAERDGYIEVRCSPPSRLIADEEALASLH